MKLKYNDGGRRASGFDSPGKDCTVRAVAITTGRDYATVYAELKALAPSLDAEGINVHADAFASYLAALGFAWVPAIGATVLSDLPKGRVIASVPEHVTAVIEGVVEDVINTEGEPVRGYWVLNGSRLYNVYRDEKKLNSYPMALGQALTMRRLAQLNYGGKTFVL